MILNYLPVSDGELIKMDTEKIDRACPRGECTWSKAMEAARHLGFYDELMSGGYSCCQVTEWYEEQRQAWQEADAESRPWYLSQEAHSEEPEASQDVVYVRKRRDQKRFGF
jgi:hypothetical protein